MHKFVPAVVRVKLVAVIVAIACGAFKLSLRLLRPDHPFRVFAESVVAANPLHNAAWRRKVLKVMADERRPRSGHGARRPRVIAAAAATAGIAAMFLPETAGAALALVA